MKADTEKLLKALERLNLEYKDLLDSDIYQMGKKVYHYKQLFKNLKFLKIFDHLIKKKNSIYIANNLVQKKIEDNWNLDEWNSMTIANKLNKKVVVYTGILGDYDNVRIPLYKDNKIDYFLFSENIKEGVSPWIYKSIPDKILELKEPTLINRYLKLHPKELFPTYDYSIYIDGNLRIISDISSMINIADVSSGIAMHRHISRTCVYKEAATCILLGKGRTDKLNLQVKSYKERGFPNNYGLLEGTMIISDLNNRASEYILTEWWNEFQRSESNRDQIALPYILWKNSIGVNEIGNLGKNIYRNPKLNIIKH